MAKTKLRYFSTFSGIGGIEKGIEQAYVDISIRQRDKQRGVEVSESDTLPKQEPMATQPLCIGYSEIDKYAIQIYERHFKHKNYGDISKINAAELPDFDLYVGGFPCQAFSIAGKRRGFDDTRGTLFFDVARILKEKRPRNFLLENVKGLLSHDNGNTFKTIITTIAELGYCVEWQVLNSKNFGVPQNRERVFIIGHLGGLPTRKVFPIREADGTINQGLEPRDTEGEVTSTLRSRYGNGTGSHINIIAHRKGYRKNTQVFDSKGIIAAMDTGQGGGRQPHVAVPVITPDRPEKRQNGRRFKENGDPSFTLTSQDKHGVYDGMRIRRLTPTECERLQGYPDGWTEGVSDSQRYKCLGNSVTVNVIEEIIKRLYEES